MPSTGGGCHLLDEADAGADAGRKMGAQVPSIRSPAPDSQGQVHSHLCPRPTLCSLVPACGGAGGETEALRVTWAGRGKALNSCSCPGVLATALHGSQWDPPFTEQEPVLNDRGGRSGARAGTLRSLTSFLPGILCEEKRRCGGGPLSALPARP